MPQKRVDRRETESIEDRKKKFKQRQKEARREKRERLEDARLKKQN
jgi:hypothetical protein